MNNSKGMMLGFSHNDGAFDSEMEGRGIISFEFNNKKYFVFCCIPSENYIDDNGNVDYEKLADNININLSYEEKMNLAKNGFYHTSNADEWRLKECSISIDVNKND